MTTNLSPRDLATVIGVSESSLKRWVDDGRLEAQRTSGGHRRIAIHEAVRFLRRSAVELAQPTKLGLADLTAQAVATVAAGGGDQALLDSVRRGDAGATRGIVLAEFILSRSLGAICDGPIAYAMNRLAQELRASGDGKLIGQRANQVLMEAIEQVRQLLNPETADSPRAVVLNLGADDALPVLMTASVLKECGYAVSSIDTRSEGTEPPNTTLVCLHVGSSADRSLIDNAIAELSKSAMDGMRAVMCGRGVASLHGTPIPAGVLIAGSMCELQSIARAALTQPSLRTRKLESGSRSKSVRLI